MSGVVDRAGVVERRGVETIPAGSRSSRPRDVGAVLCGMQMTYGSVLTGALPLVFGLGAGSALLAIVAGSLPGALLVAAMAPIGAASGTNVTVSSAAAFGLRGRYLGSAITQLVDLGYFALSLVLAVPAVDEGLHLLFGFPGGTTTTVLTMIVTAALTIGLGLFGHATVVAAQKLNVALGIGGIAAIAVSALLFPAPPPHPAAGFAFAPFVLSTTLMFANAVSYAPYVGDAARYVPETVGPARLFAVTFAGMFGGAVVSLALGLAIGAAVPDPADVLRRMIDRVPAVLIGPVVLLGVLGNAGTGAVIVYNGTLDLHAVLWRWRRVSVGLLFSATGLAIAFPALLLLDLANSIEAMCDLVGALVTPWIAIMIAAYLARARPIGARALQAFRTRDRAASPYWFRGGVNPVALVAWAAGALAGVAIHVGGRLDVSVPASAIVAATLYLLLDGRRRSA